LADFDEKHHDQLSITNPNFNPSLYLSMVHSQTPTKTIMSGIKPLKQKASSSTEAKKRLVKEYYSSFLVAKRTVDTLNVEFLST